MGELDWTFAKIANAHSDHVKMVAELERLLTGSSQSLNAERRDTAQPNFNTDKATLSKQEV